MKRNFKMIVISLTFLVIGGVLISCGKVKESKKVETTEKVTEITEVTTESKEKFVIKDTQKYYYRDYDFYIPTELITEKRENGYSSTNHEYSLIIKVFDEYRFKINEEYLLDFINSIDQFKDAEVLYSNSTTLDDKSVYCLWTGVNDKYVINCAAKSKPSGDEYMIIISIESISSEYDYFNVFDSVVKDAMFNQK